MHSGSAEVRSYLDLSFRNRIAPARSRVVALATVRGTSCFRAPYVSQSTIPATITKNIASEISLVERVLQAFTSCGAKATVADRCSISEDFKHEPWLWSRSQSAAINPQKNPTAP